MEVNKGKGRSQLYKFNNDLTLISIYNDRDDTLL